MTKTTVATLTLTGAIVGVGIFGTGYVFSKVGWIAALGYLVVLGGIQLLQHLFFAEVGIACERRLRLIGLTELYLGKRARAVVAVANTFGLWAGLLAYVVVGGTFLHILLSPFFGGTVLAYQLAWGAAGAALLYFDPAFVTKIDVLATIGLLLAVVGVVGMSVPAVQMTHYVAWTGKDLLLPYGVVLFSLSGLPAVLELEDIVGGDRRSYRRSVIQGSLLALVVTVALGFTVWGVSGAATTEDAVTGLRQVLGAPIAVMTAVFGFLAVATSYVATAMNLKETFHLDYGRSYFLSWAAAVGVPLAAFLLGANAFVSIIGFSGAVFGGITAVVVALMYIVITKKGLVQGGRLGVPVWTAYVSIAVLAAGAIGEAASVAMNWLH